MTVALSQVLHKMKPFFGSCFYLYRHQVLHTAACTPLVMLSSCDSPVPAKFAADGASVTFTSPAVARASASNSLKFSANGGIDWTTAVDFPLFGQ